MEQIAGLIFISLGIIAVWQSYFVATVKPSWSRFLLAIVLMAIGVEMTRSSPYGAVFGVLALVISTQRFLSEQWSQFYSSSGKGLIISSLLVLSFSQFQSPWDGKRDHEDRSDRVIPPSPVLTDAERLARQWSTNDKYADWPVAELMLDLCQISYRPPVEAREELKNRGFQAETIESGSMNGYVVKSNNDAIIVFRGTESGWHDVVQDLIFINSNNGSGGMHRGFRSGYSNSKSPNSMHQQVRRLLQRYQAKRVWITGHSLGGALAIVCAHDLLVDGDYEIAGVMTFGQPKVIRENMRSLLESKLADRYVFFVNGMDPVVKAVDPYLHFGHMVHYNNGRIERSQRVTLTSSPSGPNPEPPKETFVHPELDSFSEQELKEYIRQLQRENQPVTTSDGTKTYTSQQTYSSYLPNPSDHYLDSYRMMIQFLTGSGTHSIQPPN
ncbi:lipase family protein [Planctomicrobium sp. SH527]|uniref:lipase family protein n=1 Tax=Planctomicrobium sp. SH527 TaxID=3448123 RepID=UPI003F5B391F